MTTIPRNVLAVTHDVSEKPIPGVGVAVMSGRRLLLVRRLNEPRRGQWAVPGGKVELGETLVEAARREVLEETGLEVEIGDVIWAGEALGPGDPPEWHYVLIDFLGTVVGGALEAGDDAGEAGWFTMEEAMSLPLTPTMPALLDALRREGIWSD